MRDHFWRMKVYPSLGVDGTATAPAMLDDYIAKLREWRPHMLTALPVYLHVLALHLLEHGQSLQVPTIRPAGGKATFEMIQCIEQAFGGRVRENFGTAEIGTIAYDTKGDRRHRLLDGLFHLECLRGGVPVGRGELGELVITDLHNHVAPLIRYAIGDVGRMEESDDGVRFTVDSRLDETVVMADGRAVAGDGIVDFFLKQPGVKFVKIVQKSDTRFVAEIVPSHGGESAIDQAKLSEAFGRFLGCPVDLRVRMVRRVAPEASGKYRLVVSTSYSRFHEGSPGHGADVGNHIDTGSNAVSR
jgi:phenylacetate-CoA ligase